MHWLITEGGEKQHWFAGAGGGTQQCMKNCSFRDRDSQSRMLKDYLFLKLLQDPPTHRVPKPPPATKGNSKNPKIFETPPRANLLLPKVNLISPKANVISAKWTLSIFSLRVGKQGYGNRPPIDDRNPIRKFSIDCLDASKTNEQTQPQVTRYCRESRRKADTEFQYQPRIVDTDLDCGPRFADPVSETHI